MRFDGLDLNLLVVLDAVMRKRNVTAAAHSINLSQPAASAAIARLRQYFQDDLFLMQGREMIPTPLGASLAEPTRDILQRVKLTLTPQASFDPSTARRNFRVIISDFLSIVFFSKVIERVRRAAPQITFELLPFDDEPDRLLRDGKVDLLLFPDVFLRPDHPKVGLFEETLVCVACRSNRQVGAELSFNDYISMGHVAAQFGPSRKPSIEAWLLLKHGVERRIEVAVQSFSVIPHMVVGTNRIATMHLRLAEHYARSLPLRILPLPLPVPAFTEGLQWPALAERDPASIWMRKMIVDEAKHLSPA